MESKSSPLNTKNTITKCLLLLVLLNLSIQPLHSREIDTDYAKETLSVEYLTGVSDMHGMRLAYRPSNHYEITLPLLGDINIKWEVAAIFFDLHGSSKNEATYGASISPILLKQVDWLDNYPIFFEAGIGVAYVHNKKFGGVDIGSYYQFEDRLGLFTKIGVNETHLLGLRLVHYSNGGLNTKNPGLDFISFVYQKQF